VVAWYSSQEEVPSARGAAATPKQPGNRWWMDAVIDDFAFPPLRNTYLLHA
jgi:hypothetical protein